MLFRSPNKKKGKEKEGEDAKAKRKRRPRRKFEVVDLPLGDGQEAYSLKEDLISRKVDCTFGQLINMDGTLSVRKATIQAIIQEI